jgi:hypothetical protein
VQRHGVKACLVDEIALLVGELPLGQELAAIIVIAAENRDIAGNAAFRGSGACRGSEEGLAIDACGRDIRVLEEVTIDLPQPPKKSHDKKPPHDKGEQAQEEGECEELPARTLYLCLSYAECETEFAPAPFDECGCNTGSSLRPNRVCEGFRLELYDHKPSFWDEAIGEECEAEDCRVYFHEAQEHCRKPGGICCVPLAAIMDVVPGQKVTEHQIRKLRSSMVCACTLPLKAIRNPRR